MEATASETIEVAQTAMTTTSLVKHIVERRIEYLLGSLIAYQFGLLDSLVTAGTQCIA